MLLGGRKFKTSHPKCEHLHVGDDDSLLLKDVSRGCPDYILEFMKHRTGRTFTRCQFAEVDGDGAIFCTKQKF
jgi:hypothetical protein